MAPDVQGAWLPPCTSGRPLKVETQFPNHRASHQVAEHVLLHGLVEQVVDLDRRGCLATEKSSPGC
jgi:hypothetical protein